MTSTRSLIFFHSSSASIRLQRLLGKIKNHSSESLRLKVQEDETEDELVQTAIAFHKASRYQKDSGLTVRAAGQVLIPVSTSFVCVN